MVIITIETTPIVLSPESRSSPALGTETRRGGSSNHFGGLDMAFSYDPKKLWQPFGPFSMAVVQGDGRIVHLKGQVPLDEHGELVGQSDIRAQLRQVLENLTVVLDEVGGKLSDVISLIQYTT